MPTGRLMIIGGAEDKLRKRRVLREFVAASGGPDARIVVIPTASSLGEEIVEMYDALFRADLVVADLSTSNLNAAYELGIRYGVRPRATIIVAEQQFKNPFDFSHIVIRRYEHLGSDVGRREAARSRRHPPSTGA